MKFTLTLAFIYVTTALFAQSEYKQSIGLRLGSGYYDVASAAYKTFLNDASALEFNLGINPDRVGRGGPKWTSVSAAATYQHHFDIKPVDGLKWFVGGGIVLSNTFSNNDHYTGFGVGLYPTGGADYKFKKIPLAVSADVRPTFHIVEPFDYNKYNNFYPNVGVSARYTF
ncbi:hypothetical protein [Niabella ginsengisoli]|uniref:Outer membrane protein beta-barrel domain-containing protein n=1 Tax=Niabella ginsengisoli TaxID=522298 RepID=A0ABS9SDY1_9BACT|nr:hypothetical protein [Niabella ginsengisoli]MCH5596567.1 hypothetical protein [Niabella ginsengisoli]